MTRLKICGLFRERDIDYVNQYLPDYAGFLIRYTKGRRSVSAERAEELIRLLNPGISTVGVVANQPLEGAIELLSSGSLDILQLDGEEDDDYVRSLRKATGKPVWRTFSLRRPDALAAAQASSADLIALNGDWDPDSPDWETARALARPFLLSGGIHPGNAVKAVKGLSPWGLDLSSGVETDGLKDKGKISSVIAAVRGIKERKHES